MQTHDKIKEVYVIAVDISDNGTKYRIVWHSPESPERVQTVTRKDILSGVHTDMIPQPIDQFISPTDYGKDAIFTEWLQRYREHLEDLRYSTIRFQFPPIKALLIHFDGESNTAFEYDESRIKPQSGGFEVQLRGSKRVGTASLDKSTRNVTFNPVQNY